MKTICITGSTDGIGKLAALQLAKAGHQLILHGRNATKLENSISEIKSASGNKQITGVVADLANLDSVREMIQELLQKVTALDVLINNAGVFKSGATYNDQGIDLRFAVNYFAPYVLTSGLIPLLKKGNQPRLINLSSAAQAPVSLDALAGNEGLKEQQAYAQSKLALTMWSFDLARKESDINVIAVNPGSLLNTKMVQQAYGQHWSSADKGAEILYRLTTDPQFADSSGKYFDNDQGSFNQAHPDAYDAEKIEKLIATTQHILES